MHRKATLLFTWVAGLVLSAVLVAVLCTEKLALHAWLNQRTRPSLDDVFATATHLADGWIAVGFGLVCLFIRWRWFLLVAASVAGSALVTQALKHLVFDDHDRPSTFMAAMPHLRLVPGVEMLHHNSFPSGHSTCAFSMCFALAIVLGRPWAAILSALLACALGSTRVYLSQHFTEDVLCGGIIGVGMGWLAYWWLYESSFSKKTWLDGSLFRRKNL